MALENEEVESSVIRSKRSRSKFNQPQARITRGDLGRQIMTEATKPYVSKTGQERINSGKRQPTYSIYLNLASMVGSILDIGRYTPLMWEEVINR